MRRTEQSSQQGSPDRRRLALVTATTSAGFIALSFVVTLALASPVVAWRPRTSSSSFESSTPESTPEILTGAATNLTEDSVTLRGFVNPAGSSTITNCQFDYVTEADFLATGYASDQVALCSPAPPYSNPIEVSADLSGLHADTTYHYRLVAENDQGITSGSDNAFTTPAPPLVETEPEPEIEEKAVHHGPVDCTKRKCSRSLIGSDQPESWMSPKFPPTFGWLFSVYRHGQALQFADRTGGCAGTFAGRGIIVAVDGCGNRFKLIYLGSGHFTIRWRVFENCLCTNRANRPNRRSSRTR